MLMLVFLVTSPHLAACNLVKLPYKHSKAANIWKKPADTMLVTAKTWQKMPLETLKCREIYDDIYAEKLDKHV